MKIILPLILIVVYFAGCSTAPNQRVETVAVLGEIRGFRSAGTQLVLNADFQNPDKTVVYFDCLDLTILKPEQYRGTKITVLLPFAGGHYAEIRTPKVKVSVVLNKRALTSKEPDWTVYRLEDLKIE